MKLLQSSAKIETFTPDACQVIERAGRTCYQSQEKMTHVSAERFVRMLRQRGHFAMFDHAHAGVRFEVDRGVSHEIVRHRIGVGYAQESTRYCAYKKEITFILPPFSYKYPQWEKSMLAAEEAYLSMLRDGASPEVARSVLPMSLRTELFVTGSFTYWRHLFELRAAKAAHPAMREVMLPLLGEFIEMWPAAFDDLKPLTIVY